MAELKTQENDASVTEFLDRIEDEKRREDCYVVLEMMRKITGREPRMWGDDQVGFGHYEYTYKSGHSGRWYLCGFAPRKAQITIYIMAGFAKYEDLMSKLGKYKNTKSCLHIKKLEDVDQKILARLIKKSVTDLKNTGMPCY